MQGSKQLQYLSLSWPLCFKLIAAIPNGLVPAHDAAAGDSRTNANACSSELSRSSSVFQGHAFACLARASPSICNKRCSLRVYLLPCLGLCLCLCDCATYFGAWTSCACACAWCPLAVDSSFTFLLVFLFSQLKNDAKKAIRAWYGYSRWAKSET